MRKIFAALLLLSSQAGFAQFHYGVELGGAYNKMTDDKNVWGATARTKSTFGGQIGLIGDYGLTEHIYVQPSVFFTIKSSNETATTSLNLPIAYQGLNLNATGSIAMEQKSKFSYIEVPVNILYKWGQPGEGRFFIGLAPYIAYGVGGKQTVVQNIKAGVAVFTAFDSTIRNTSSKTFASDSFGYKSLDYGFKICEGYEFPGGFFFRAEFGLGLANLSNYSDAKSHNMSFALNIGYMINNKRKKAVAGM